MIRFDLTGLRADNLVAFMAALGTLRSCTMLYPDAKPKITWLDCDGRWYAAIQIDANVTRESLLQDLHDILAKECSSPAINIADDLNLTIEEFHAVLAKSAIAATTDERDDTDLLAAFGSDVIESRTNGKPNGNIADTAFRTMSGAGHQHFLGTMRTVIQDTTNQHLAAALFSRWEYADPMQNHSLRWDPQDDIRYALQWTEPSKDNERKKTGTMWGAYRLAIEALPLFVTAPQTNTLATTGFYEGKRGTVLTWPIWQVWIDLATTQSLLALPELQHLHPDRRHLARRGIRELFRCRRVTEGKFRNFTAAQPA